MQDLKTPQTMAQLMSHTAGFGVNADYASQNFGRGDLQGMIDTPAKLPLYSQPGDRLGLWALRRSQGYIVQKLSGQPLDVFMAEHLFGPLGMADTGFWVAPEKAARIARVNTYKDGKIVSAPTPAGGGRDPSTKPSFLSGSGGLSSTTEDYWKFCNMVLNGGHSPTTPLPQGRHRQADAKVGVEPRGDGRPLRPRPAGRRLRPRLRG